MHLQLQHIFKDWDIMSNSYEDRRKTLQKLSSVVIQDEQMRRKKGNEPALDKELQLRYITSWKKLNEEWLNTVFGVADGPQLKFLTGVLFVTSYCSTAPTRRASR